jgi:hypothetical protein
MPISGDREAEMIPELLARLRKLEDVEAIRQLHYAYCRLMDEGFDADALGALWIEDGAWEGGPYSRKVGRQAIVDFFRVHGTEVAFAAHYLANEEISLAGDRASCRCIGVVPASMTIGGKKKDEWMLVTWNNTVVRHDGKWLFETLSATVNKSLAGRL